MSSRIVWPSYEDACAIVRPYGMTSRLVYRRWRRKHPEINLPYHPQETYAKKGWTGWGDFLGKPVWLSCEEAACWAREQGVYTRAEWRVLALSVDFPVNIPQTPDIVYKKQGSWVSWWDFLRGDEQRFWLFEQAREYARERGIKSSREWIAFARSGKLPSYCPHHPHITYKDAGWYGWPDFLGVKRVAGCKYALPFNQCRAYARKSGIRSIEAWALYHRENPKSGVPVCPHKVYRDSGWVDWYDFLGKPRPDRVD